MWMLMKSSPLSNIKEINMRSLPRESTPGDELIQQEMYVMHKAVGWGQGDGMSGREEFGAKYFCFLLAETHSILYSNGSQRSFIINFQEVKCEGQRVRTVCLQIYRHLIAMMPQEPMCPTSQARSSRIITIIPMDSCSGLFRTQVLIPDTLSFLFLWVRRPGINIFCMD